jgi:hypothetical protein
MRHQKDDEIKELKEQVRDLMFYLEAQGKVRPSSKFVSDPLQGVSILAYLILRRGKVSQVQYL